ncbi:hypothetical protein POPTR_009G017300v4 [Populus trichocarpa]|uniref:Uncharacterized protein n=2 Tax=Populus trichocarpa TaxID=3694 RepID=A0ACC0SFW8_POPTR|nr:glycosyltransferase BC10 [Populus trichocarpa]KAI9388127.1 hypothetical protein POPTR_009G017300v4 [Populus trichocarpa]KAI9388128.1 hypothetical protein POPTR_009G017300v4 [Populus trichocarpa]
MPETSSTNCPNSIKIGPIMFTTQFLLVFSLLLSLPILFLLAPRIFPPHNPSIPISPSDEQDDLYLFRKAAAAAASSSFVTHYPSAHTHFTSKSKKLKIAFLFLTNTDLFFAPLWEQFFKSADKNLFNIYVHADPYSNVTKAKGVFSSQFIPNAKRTYRASPTLISATRRLLATAILDDPTNTFFAVLSQYCIPLHSFKYVYDSLISSKSFDFSSSESGPESTQYNVKIEYKSFVEIISKERRLWKRYVARGRYSMMPEVPFEKFRGGSQFFVITRRHALMVIEDRRLWNKFKQPCNREDECYPEEHYFPTLLSMQDPKGCTKYTLTRVNWTGTRNGHPYTYKASEISPVLIQELRKSNYSSSYLFARKFEPNCLKPLMKIADEVIFQD